MRGTHALDVAVGVGRVAANNKTQRVEKVGGVSVKTFDYVYDALNRMERSTKTLPSAAPGTAGNWTGAMTLASARPGVGGRFR